MKIKQKTILFCSEVYTSLGVLRCLGEAGFRPECYCYGPGCNYLLSCKYISRGKAFTTKEDVLKFLIKDYPEYKEKPVLLTIPDYPACLVDLHKDELEKKFILMSAGEAGAIVHWMDKKNISLLAKKHGLIIPWAIELAKNAPVPNNLEYPVFTKSIKTADGGKGEDTSVNRSMT